MSFPWLRATTVLLILGGLSAASSYHVLTGEAAENAMAKLSAVPVTLGGKAITAFVANDGRSRTEGLLNWDTITEDQGMLLDFILPAEYAIHMQGMKFPIDAVWIDANRVIRLVYEDIRPNSGQVYYSLFPCRYCLELQAGFCRKFGVKVGQTIGFGSSIGQ